MRVQAPLDWRSLPILPAAATARLDAAAARAGASGQVLMERAGRAVVRAITARFPPQPVAVLCGPGNNGGDGYVVARRLAAAGWPVRVVSPGDPDRLSGDAAVARARWSGRIDGAADGWSGPERLVVDALFGVGLARPLGGAVAALVDGLDRAQATVVAVDIASGIEADTGAVLGTAVRAALTVSFVTAKPGHLLLPGRLHAGQLEVADIGIAPPLVAAEDVGIRACGPARWSGVLPRRRPATNKYDFGHAIVVAGPSHATGAARLAAVAALRVGAGLVTVVAGPEATAVCAAHLTTVMTRPVTTAADLRRIVADRRITAALIGPACGLDEPASRRVDTLLAAGKPLVLDADALTILGPRLRSGRLTLPRGCVLTPHDGEFARLCDATGDRLSRARAAAARLGAVVVLKGADTVVAEPGGRADILADAPATLATAGTGDVLAGLVLGLLAQGVPPFDAASAAVWIHAEAARRRGGSLIAEDLLETIAAALAAVADD